MYLDCLGLQAFLNIAERGSFTRAAEHLNLSQTALSHRLRKLEDDLGVKLFVRTTRQVVLTPQGLELLPRARRIIEEMQDVFHTMQQQSVGRYKRLNIACLPTLAARYIPRALGMFMSLHPDVKVKVFDAPASEIADRVQRGDAEFGVTIISIDRWDLETRPIVKDPFVLVVPVRHKFAKMKSLRWTQLEGSRLIRISQQPGNRVLLDDAFMNFRDSMNFVSEVENIATAVGMVSEGLGLTIVPRVGFDIVKNPSVTSVALKDPQIAHTIGVIVKRGLPLSRAAEVLLGLIEEDLLDAYKPAKELHA